MPSDLTPSSLLRLSRELLGRPRPADILELAAREIQGWLQAQHAYASYVVPGQPWERALHLAITPDLREAAPAAISAMFAVHRRVANQRGSIILQRSPDTEVLLDALSTAESKAQSLLAIPLYHHDVQALAEIVLLSSQDISHAIADKPIAELTQLTAVALENAQQLAVARRDQERLLLLEAATAEAVWDWNLATDEFWWGGGIHNLLGAGPKTRNLFSSKFDRVDPAEAERVQTSFGDALRSPSSSWSAEYGLLRPDGSRVEVEDRAYFLRDAKGDCYRVVGALRDIGPLKQLLTRETAARQQAEAASRTKDQFLAILGHELRNPLAPILTALELMKLRSNEHQRERAIIERQAQHLVRLVDDLLDVSRIARGLIELKRQRVELHRMVSEAIEMARPLIDGRRHAVEVDVDFGLHAEADPARLAQVLSNLVTNAAKYTDPGGTIRVRGCRVDEWLELTVEDTGTGISPSLLPHIFDMFVQERQASDRARGGMGLGLSIVRNLVALHGGTVTAHSEGHGRGSRFTVRLPPLAREPTPADGLSLEELRLPSKRALRVLVVDDNQDAADLLGRFLKSLGHHPEIVYDPLTALERLQTFTPELALVDIGLPVMDGHELARHLRQRLSDVRLVAVTGYGQDSDRERAVAAGFDEHVVKPLTLEHLHRLLQ